MPFGMLSLVDPRNHVLDGGTDLPWEGAIFWHARQHWDVSCAKTAEPVEIRLGSGLGWVEASMCYMARHIGATWQIRLNRSCAVAMRPYVKLLW